MAAILKLLYVCVTLNVLGICIKNRICMDLIVHKNKYHNTLVR